MEKRKIEVYIDGSSVDVNATVNQQNKRKGLPEVPAEWHGAYAGVFLVDGVEVLRMKGYEKGGTIGKMELMALAEAVHQCNLCGWSDAIIHSDSQYVVNGYNDWINGWVKKGFTKIKFPEIWKDLWHGKGSVNCKDIKVVWVKGHHECDGNHVADKLANEALGAGITGWKVSGKERFLLFDKVESYWETSGHKFVWENEFGSPEEIANYYKKDSGFCPTCGKKDFGFCSDSWHRLNRSIPNHHEEAGAFPVITEQMQKDAAQYPLLKGELFTHDNDFTDMAKKKYPMIEILNKPMTAPRELSAMVKKEPEKVYPTWYEEQIAKHRELIKKQTEEFNQMMDRYAKHVEGIIHELKIEQEKNGTRSTKSNP